MGDVNNTLKNCILLGHGCLELDLVRVGFALIVTRCLVGIRAIELSGTVGREW